MLALRAAEQLTAFIMRLVSWGAPAASLPRLYLLLLLRLSLLRLLLAVVRNAENHHSAPVEENQILMRTLVFTAALQNVSPRALGMLQLKLGHTQTHIHIYTHTHTQPPPHKHKHKYKHTNTNTIEYMHARKHART
jgi:hypothetical protein